ncbi:E4 ORF3 [Bat mastadenovirus WIV17]|uniref:E4 ORF3 n=1 Tax=Bat mastadenovirus WIV17 TaxID=1986505 RepID=A0A1X9RIU9_9ADEN|nr:E4 ORF3 [Bat mastadenovirus WIV17]ARQ79768.1 E4 ORF3 [Bat mastadenovirus WIV17]
MLYFSDKITFKILLEIHDQCDELLELMDEVQCRVFSFNLQRAAVYQTKVKVIEFFNLKLAEFTPEKVEEIKEAVRKWSKINADTRSYVQQLKTQAMFSRSGLKRSRGAENHPNQSNLKESPEGAIEPEPTVQRVNFALALP